MEAHLRLFVDKRTHKDNPDTGGWFFDDTADTVFFLRARSQTTKPSPGR
jgi:hypothetical protein